MCVKRTLRVDLFRQSQFIFLFLKNEKINTFVYFVSSFFVFAIKF